MVLQRAVSGTSKADLPFASNHDKHDLLFDWFPVKTWKSSANGELFDDTNWIRGGRKLKRKLDEVGLVDLETDDALVDAFQDGPSCSNITDRNYAGPKNYRGEVRPKTNQSEVCTMTDFLDSELEIDDDRSTRDICIYFLKNNGLLAGDWSECSNVLIEVGGTLEEGSFLQSCELCGTQDDTRKMLLCDQCDKAFHVSCCNSKTKTVPEDEWFCQVCSKLNDKAPTLSCWNEVPRYKLGPIARMLKYTESHVSRVRVGEHYQAEVPQWSNQIANDIDCIDEPLEVRPEETLNFHGSLKDKFPKRDSVSNWLQCRQGMIDDEKSGQATTCGKWRRAPISEVQKDDWECSSAVVWDPLHSDCAVPQELETDQVLLQLKFVQRLQARLAAKRP